MDGRSFRRRGGEKKAFFVNFQRSEFVCFWSVSRESVKELIYQKKNGGHQASKRVISHNASKQPSTSCLGTLYIPSVKVTCVACAEKMRINNSIHLNEHLVQLYSSNAHFYFVNNKEIVFMFLFFVFY